MQVSVFLQPMERGSVKGLPTVVRTLKSMVLLAALVLTSLTPLVSFADSSSSWSKHRLQGVVVSAETGKPVAGARVLLVDARRGLLFFDPQRGIWSWGWDRKFLRLFTLRNGRSTCTAVTGADGRFELTSFIDPEAQHTLAALHIHEGVALLEGFQPAEFENGTLRIELEPAARIHTTYREINGFEDVTTHVNVSLVDESPPRADDEPHYFATRIRLTEPDKPADEPDGTYGSRTGPIPGHRRYRLLKYATSGSWGNVQKLFSREVALEHGQTLEVALEPGAGATLSGRVTGMGGAGLADVNVMLTVNNQPSTLIGTVTDSEGNYSLQGVPPGNHKLSLKRYAKRISPG